MHDNTTMPAWAKWAGGLALLAAALTAGTLGLILNFSHGLEAGFAVGIAFGLADLAKILIPLVAGMVGWSRQMRITAAICVAVSLWSATNVYLDGAGAALLAKQHGAATYNDAGKWIAELETGAASLRALANNEAKSGGCGKSCRALLDKADQAAVRLDQARAKRTDINLSKSPVWRQS